MGQYREITRVVDLAATGVPAATVRVWDAPTGEPFKTIGIIVSSNGEADAGNTIDWAVYYGGTWTGGDPFASGSTHNGGVSQGNGNIGAGEVFHVVYEDASILPSNRRYTVPNDRTQDYKGRGGGPVVLELANKQAKARTFYVTFVSESVSESQ